MENNLSILGVITEECIKYPQGIVTVKIKDKHCFIWLWCQMRIEVYEQLSLDLKEFLAWGNKLAKHEIKLSSNVIDIFQLNEDLVYVLCLEGILYSFQMVISNSNSSEQYMEVDDLFGSPVSSDTLKWEETTAMTIKNCDCVIGACHGSFGFAALVIKDKCLSVHIYSYPKFSFKYCIDFQIYNSQTAVLACCETASLMPSFKLYFQDNLEVLDNEIIIVGLSTGLLLWFSANNPSKGPVVLFSAHHEVKNIHYVKDTGSGLLSQLLVVLTSGSVIIFGEEQIFTKFVPDSVKASCCINNHLITSNLVDCYNSELKISMAVDLNSVVLPVKGVSAMSKAWDSELLVAATVHGTVYCLDIKAAPQETASCFTIPDEHVIDTMLTQAKNLDSIYKQLADEDSTLKAVSTAITANALQLFHLTLNIMSDNEFCLVTKLTKAGVIFSSKLWLANVEVTRKQGFKENVQTKFHKEFSCDNELQLSVKESLSIGDDVSLDLILLLKSQQPILIVHVDKIEIDAGYLMITQGIMPTIISREESFEEILYNLNCDSLTKRRLQEWKLCLKIPDVLDLNSVLPSILINSQQRISKDEWDKLVGGKKHNIHVIVDSQAVLMQLDLASRELTITSYDIQLCYQIKEAVLKRLKNSEDKYICENVALEVQALNQEFEIETFKDEQDFQLLDIIRKRLRSTLSCHFLL